MTSSFDESKHPRAASGEFTDRVNDAPTTTLGGRGVVLPDTPIEVLRQRQAEAERLRDAADRVHAEASVAAATGILRQAFPNATMAVFSRDWDEPEEDIRLIQILGEPDVEAAPDQAKSPEQYEAWWAAHGLISGISIDQRDLIAGDGEEHNGWDEFQLDLTSAAKHVEPARHLVNALDAPTRRAIDSELSGTEGRMYSTVDNAEIKYQLTEADVFEDYPDEAARAIAVFGSADAAAEAIGDSEAWEGFRDVTDRQVRASLPAQVLAGLRQAVATAQAKEADEAAGAA